MQWFGASIVMICTFTELLTKKKDKKDEEEEKEDKEKKGKNKVE